MVRAGGAPGGSAAALRRRKPRGSFTARSAPEVEVQRDLEGWHPARKLVYHAVESSAVKTVVAAVILGNTALVVLETDHTAACEGQHPPPECGEDFAAARTANTLFLSVYAFEMVLKMFALRLEYFHCPSDIFDAVIVFVGILGEVMGSMSGLGILRLFRIGRLAKALKASTACNEVKVFISGIGSAFKAIMVGAILIFFTLFIFAIAAVMIINPQNQAVVRTGLYDDEGCDRCKVAYSSVSQAMLTLLQIVLMGDAWGDFSVPIIAHSPPTVLFFICASFTISLGLTNLILAVILDKAIVKPDFEQEQETSRETARKEFVVLCSDLDTDQNGSLSIEEMLNGYDSHELFQDVLDCLDVDRSDLILLHEMMDREKTGKVSYSGFATELQNLRGKDTRKMLAFVKFYVEELHSLQADLKLFLSNQPPEALQPAEVVPMAKVDADENPSIANVGGSASSAVLLKGREEKMRGVALSSLRVQAVDRARSAELQAGPASVARPDFDRVLGTWAQELCANLEGQVKLMHEQMEERLRHFSPHSMLVEPGYLAAERAQAQGSAAGDSGRVRFSPRLMPRMGPGPQLFASPNGELSFGVPVVPASQGDTCGVHSSGRLSL